MKKKEIRDEYLLKRKSLSNSEVENRSEHIAEIFFKEFDLSSIEVVHVFIPIQKFNEVNTWPIINGIWNNYPYLKVATSITQDEKLVHVLINEGTPFVNDKWGIPTPQNSHEIDADQIDLVITPLLAFDQNLHRVGYGKGYYDGFFAQCRSDTQKVGLSLFPKLAEPIEDINEFDQVLDRVITN